MGNFLKILFLICVLAVPSFATQVTMTATTINNFHPPSLGAPVTGTLSATQSSPIVTGTFRSQWVNLSGFKINIQGVDYVVSSVDSTTQIRLTTSYTSTTGSKTYSVYPFVLLRFYALQRFTENTTGDIIQPGTPGSSAWYKQVACSVIGTTLYIPTIVLPSTTDSVNPGERNAKWYAAFYYPSGGLISTWDGLTNFGLDFAPNPKTWNQAIAYANPGVPPPSNNETYSKSQIDALFHTGGGGGSGTVTQVNTGAGLQGGPITNTGTISMATVIGASTCTNCDLHYNSFGQITSATNGSSAGGTVTSVTAGAGLSGGTITTSGTISITNTLLAGSNCTSCNLNFNSRGQITSYSNGGGGGGGAIPGQYVLRFDAADSRQVHHGYFWPAGPPLPTFYWDSWVAPGGGTGSTGYVISESGSGAHALLWGWNTSVSGCNVTGNIYNGSFNTSFGSYDSVNDQEWVYSSIGWDGAHIRVYLNGIQSGIVPFTGPRYAYDGTLQVGGSDHSNYTGKIAMLRGYEGAGAPLVVPPVPSAGALLRMSPTGIYNGEGIPSFFADYTLGGKIIPDISPGFMGRQHPGTLYNQNNTGNLPLYEIDTNAPTYGDSGLPPQPVGYRTGPPSTPVGALVFDSFTRDQQVRVFGRSTTLGSTESGSRGPLVWQYGGFGAGWGNTGSIQWGIFNGRATMMTSPSIGVVPQIAFVDAGTANQDVRVDRVTLTYATGETGLVFRLVDDQNFWFFHTWNDTGIWTQTPAISGNLKWEVSLVSSGVVSTIAGGHLSSNTADTLRVNANGTTISVYCGAVLLTTITNGTFQTATKAGIGRYYTNMESPRWDNFTVLPAS